MIGKSLKVIRKKAGLSQYELGQRAGLSRSRIKNIESASNIVLSVLKKYLNNCAYKASFGIFDEKAHLIENISQDVNIPLKLKELRCKNKLIQNDIALKTGLSRSRIEQIENGTGNIKLKTFYIYVNGLGYELRLGIKKIGSCPLPWKQK
jgi:transcriptional regulator with XRE-family HTH domain